MQSSVVDIEDRLLRDFLTARGPVNSVDMYRLTMEFVVRFSEKVERIVSEGETDIDTIKMSLDMDAQMPPQHISPESSGNIFVERMKTLLHIPA